VKRDFALSTLPAGVVLGPLSREVFLVLAEHTSFPWPILQAQCKREGLTATTLAPEELDCIVEHLAVAVGRFTSPDHADEVRRQLRELASRRP
jgi:hypothetical protein